MNSNILITAQNFLKSEVQHNNLKILELIAFLDIPPVDFLDDFSGTLAFKKSFSLKRYKKSKPKKQYYLEWIDCKFETDLLSFLFNYLKFTDIKEGENLMVYQKMLDILKVFEESLIPSTLLWILDLVELMVRTMKVNAKEFDSTKYKYQLMLSKVMGSLVRMQGHEIQIDYIFKKDEIFEVVLPLNPSINELFTRKNKDILAQ